ncbi:MAG: hypothetical protein HUJ65_04740 [Oscillospiraceae bacterium]|nr:hypothetical protein [Oscillospiraceae bacterium]
MEQNTLFLERRFKLALIPCMLSILGNTINILIDGILVGQYIGGDGLAAISLCVPIYLVLCVIGSFVVSGTAINASLSLGAGNVKDASTLYTTCIFTCVCASIIIMLPGWFGRNIIAGWLGGDAEVQRLVADYIGITLLGAAPKILIYVPFWYLRLDARNNLVTVTMLLMAAVNTLLDILFLSVLNLGVAGAALASVIATTTSCVIGFAFLRQEKSSFHLDKEIIRGKKRWAGIALAGSPSALNNLADTVRLLCINALLMHWGGKDLVAVFTAVNCLNAFSLAVTTGNPQAASAMLGVSHGEHDNGSIKHLIWLQWKWGLIYTAIFAAATIVLSEVITNAYALPESLLPAIICVALSMPGALWNNILITWYNHSRRNMLANALIVLRVLFFSVAALAMLLAAGLIPWVFIVLGEYLTCLIWLIATRFMSGNGKKLSRYLLLDDRLEREGKVLSFSVNANAEEICDASQKITDYCESNGMTPKQVMSISLAIEELMMVIRDRGDGELSYDVRAFSLPGETGIRIRYGGRQFNPFDWSYAAKGDDFDISTGVNMIKSIAKKVNYQWVFGTNSLQIFV